MKRLTVTRPKVRVALKAITRKREQALTLILIIGCLSKVGAARAQPPVAVAILGSNLAGQTSMPIAAQSDVTAVAVGNSHNVALKSDGTVVAWGWNDYGQVTATPSAHYPPIDTANPVTLEGEGGAALSNVAAVAAGLGHTVALIKDGPVVAWGFNLYGQTSVPFAADEGVVAIAAGFSHTVALKNDGSVLAWGAGEVDSPENPENRGQSIVPDAAQSGVIAIAACGNHTVALKQDGTVVAWGHNEFGQTNVPNGLTGVTAITAGYEHSVALRNDGSVVAWGRNIEGQASVPVEARSGVTAIAAGEGHTVALKNDGSVVAWGSNGAGQTSIPVEAQGRIKAIAAGGDGTVLLVVPSAPIITGQPKGQAVNRWHSAGLSVTATGFPLYYQWSKDGLELGGETSATYRLTLAKTNHTGHYTVVVSNPAGRATSSPPAVVTVTSARGSVLAWGMNNYLQSTVPLEAQSEVIAIAAGGSAGGFVLLGHSVALKNDGSVVAWGNNEFGQVTGTPTTNPAGVASPVTLAGKVLTGVTGIAAGSFHTVALRSDGTVVAWGYNDWGQVTGIPENDFPYSATANPVTLGGRVLSEVAAVSAGRDHTVALKKDGTVVGWGSNDHGQVRGAPSASPPAATSSPVMLEGRVLSGVVAVAAGWHHTVALKKDGSVVAWGGTTGTEAVVPLAAQSGVRAIAAGASHTVALKDDGSVIAWGNIDFGGTTVPDSLSGVEAIAAGGGHSAALLKDGSVVVWGRDDSGRIIPPSALNGVTTISAGGEHIVALLGTALPRLDARRMGNELVLTWPANSVTFVLQSRLDLNFGQETWIGVTNSPELVEGRWTVTNAFSSNARFYRLQEL